MPGVGAVVRASLLGLLLLGPPGDARAGGEPPAGWTDEARAVVAEMLADARARSSLAETGSAGHDAGFYVESADRAFRLSLGGLLVFRYTYSRVRDDASDQDEFGFSLPRARLWLRGTAHEKFSFLVRTQFSGVRRNEFFEDDVTRGNAILDRAWVGYRFTEGVELRWGLQVGELSRENEHAPEAQLGVASSPTDSVFGVGGFTGLLLRTEHGAVRTRTSFSDGARAIRNDFDAERNADFAITFKADYAIAGDAGVFGDFTSFPGSTFAMLVGGGVHWENGAEVGDPPAGSDVLLGLGELSLEGDGWNVYGAFHWAYNDVSTTRSNVNDYGVVVQGGVFVTGGVELFARFDAVFPDRRRETLNDEFKTLTGGVNYYLFPGSTAAKFSLDVVYAFDDEAGSLVEPSTNTGIRASDEDDQFALRAQFAFRF